MTTWASAGYRYDDGRGRRDAPTGGVEQPSAVRQAHLPPSVGLALIARNEAKRLPHLLESIKGAFDQVVLVDTGSEDDTTVVFHDWARDEEKRNVNFKWCVRSFTWIKDFGAARHFAQSFLVTDWEVWADCDDIITGAQNLRAVAAQAPPNVMGFLAGYNYAQHPETGACLCYLKRERLVRRGHARWINRVHEAQIVDGPVVELEPTVVEWVHQKQYHTVEEMQVHDAERNLEILRKWNEDEPNNPRTLAYIGTETMVRGETEDAKQWFQRFLALDTDWDEERAQVHRKLAVCHLIANEVDDAISLALAAMRVHPSWADSHLTLAEAYYLRSEWAKSIYWAREVLRLGEPQTLLIINPLDYSFQARKLLAGALGTSGQLDEAVAVGQEALALNPGDQALHQSLAGWRAAAKREHTANTIAMLAQQLVAHDEQLKAIVLLEQCVPHFALDHQGLVNLLSSLRERLHWIDNPRALLDHYENGGSKPEDFLPEDKLDEVPAALPRTQFLYHGLLEQLAERRHVERQAEMVGQALQAVTDA